MKQVLTDLQGMKDTINLLMSTLLQEITFYGMLLMGGFDCYYSLSYNGMLISQWRLCNRSSLFCNNIPCLDRIVYLNHKYSQTHLNMLSVCVRTKLLKEMHLNGHPYESIQTRAIQISYNSVKISEPHNA